MTDLTVFENVDVFLTYFTDASEKLFIDKIRTPGAYDDFHKEMHSILKVTSWGKNFAQYIQAYSLDKVNASLSRWTVAEFSASQIDKRAGGYNYLKRIIGSFVEKLKARKFELIKKEVLKKAIEAHPV
jgi:hypothetical protein